MIIRRLPVVACALVAAGCSWLADPRERLAALGVPYTADAYVAQAGAGDVDAVALFLESGMPPDTKDGGGSPALIGAAAGGHDRVVETLIEHGASLEVRDAAGSTALIAAAWGGHVPVMTRLLESGAQVNAKGESNQAALITAVRARRPEVVRLLLEHGAHAWEHGDDWSALMLASFLGDLEIVRLLLARDANVHARDDRGRTAVMHAAAAGHLDVLQALVAKGADINAVDAGGHTALMFAANNGEPAIVAALRDAGADVAARNRNGQTASSYAEANGHRDVVALLARKPASAVPASSRTRQPAEVRAQADPLKARAEIARAVRERLAWPEDRALFRQAAAHAWAFANRNYQPATGFIQPFSNYTLATIWDVGSMIAALYSAHGLGLLDDRVYAERVRTLLTTLGRLPLYNNRTFNKAYDTRTTGMVFHADNVRWRWAGWSTTDIGRLLIWLKILSFDPRFTELAGQIVRRAQVSSLARAGYLWGEDRDPDGRTREYQEGAIGYEQYAARGFELWGVRARRAVDLMANALPVSVLGEPLLADFRRWDRLTSEPFLLWGLELGWDPRTEALARGLLRAQEARYRRTGRLTITGEDAIPQPPHFFYYYCVYADGKEFAIDTQDRGAIVEGPRWVSAKSAYAFHALTPTAYTEQAVRATDAARAPGGWASGTYEGSGRSTGSVNINTAAVVLTAALFHLRGEPLLAVAQRLPDE